MGDWAEDALRHKYDPLPEDAPRHRKKSKKRHAKSDHKHEYEEVCVDAHTESFAHKEYVPTFHIAVRCRVCGRLQNVKLWQFVDKPPDDMPLYEVDDFYELVTMKELPDGRRIR